MEGVDGKERLRLADKRGLQSHGKPYSLAWKRGAAGGGKQARLRWKSHEIAQVFLVKYEVRSPAQREEVWLRAVDLKTVTEDWSACVVEEVGSQPEF